MNSNKFVKNLKQVKELTNNFKLILYTGIVKMLIEKTSIKKNSNQISLKYFKYEK